MKIKVLLVDDHLLVMHGIQQLLENEIDLEVVNTVCDPALLETEIKKHNPNVVVMDIRMKNDNGIEWVRKIAQTYPTCKVVILSGYNYDEYIQAAYEAGAYAFVTKESSVFELANAIRQTYLGVKSFPINRLDHCNSPLTKTELDILQLISEDKTNAEISELLHISRRTVEHHVSSILRKLDADSRVGAVVKAIKLGLIG
ncbi:response regulator transcription factor [Geobacillus sp. FSL W8-0032]|uniref:Transcriptional regulatory protein LiaR n=1 Tax=Geobacillus icigianus TaxID=1430331 RepID=A0ABU6BJM2_9BACL|nr:response regulator transcription factor [Geobacillus icigianus]MEB3752047.1 Transcriptional regulatory protein LiaR [Geobacillus icigianus]